LCCILYKMKKIRILMVLGNTKMGGTQMFILNVLRNIDFSRFQIDIAVNSSVDTGGIVEELRSYGCKIFYWPYFKIINYFQFMQFWRKFFKEHKYDIVHGHSTNSASLYLRYAKEAGCVTVAHCHSTGYRGNIIQQKIKRHFANKVGIVADYWFACSDTAALKLYGEVYKSYPRYYEIPNAINVDNYKYQKSIANRIRLENGIKDDELLCGHIGTFSAPKNHIFLLDIFAEVLKQHPKSQLVCCGAGVLRPIVEKKAKSMGIFDKIIFPGVVNNANEYLMAMDVLVFPSLFEGFGIAILEAEAAGTQVVMSDTIPNDVDLTDLVHRHSLNESPKEWADTICNMPTVDRLGYNKSIAESKYNMRTCINLISSLYEEMARNKKR